ncbi:MULTISPECIES: glycohydrolase toxin TNT-related protein [unclassified Spirillospora]|uniref:glycohydrolase toxin TNT-related protein n=1 Tax=unclassified Spirillospora TaxID=2642701 RepID=UPI0037111504
MPSPEETPSPQDERELVARLAPESPIMFARARRLLRDMTRDGAARFRVGVAEHGCRSVLHGENGWQAVHRPDGSADAASDHATARAATAHAVGGILSEDGVSLNSTILEIADLIRRESHEYTWTWALTETAQRISAESRNATRPSGTPCIALEGLVGRAGYIVLRPAPTPSEGPFVDVHTVWSMMAFNLLPDTPGEPAEILSEGTILDGYGDTDDVFLYEPGTPFTRRGLWDEPARHTHRSYRVRRPLHVYPSFPTDKATISVADTTGQGRGYYLVDTIAALLATGTLRETTEGP